VTGTSKELTQQVLRGFAASIEGAVTQPCMFGTELKYVQCPVNMPPPLNVFENTLWIGEKLSDWTDYAA
jgi:hypothetical protein